MDLCVMTLRRAIDLMNQKENYYKNDLEKKKELRTIRAFIASKIFFEILKGLYSLHLFHTPIIHRDLKPENILLSDGTNGRFVKISDFGLSTFHVREDQSHTQNRGTKNYMAPEVDRGKYDTKADMYSIGVILSELFSFQTTTNSERYLKQMIIFSENNCYFQNILSLLLQILPLYSSNNPISGKNRVIAKLCEKLTKPSPEQRPFCDDIIMDKNNWYTEFDLIEDLNFVKNICNRNDYTFENDFMEYFISQVKNMNDEDIPIRAIKQVILTCFITCFLQFLSTYSNSHRPTFQLSSAELD